jgi:membrane protease YdiL (CAAX protease family)
MIGILVILGISWILLHFGCKVDLRVIGLVPNAGTLKQFVLGVFFLGLISGLFHSLLMVLGDHSFDLIEDITLRKIGGSLYWDLKSVITEELLFRGALLYILIHRIGIKYAILISALAFGIYHWFTMGIIGQWIPMVFIFICTGAMGYGWALAFARSKSIYLPIGLHLGWNVVQNTIFSKGPLGMIILMPQNPQQINGAQSLVNALGLLLVIPIINYLWVRYGIKSKTYWTEAHN